MAVPMPNPICIHNANNRLARNFTRHPHNEFRHFEIAMNFPCLRSFYRTQPLALWPCVCAHLFIVVSIPNKMHQINSYFWRRMVHRSVNSAIFELVFPRYSVRWLQSAGKRPAFYTKIDSTGRPFSNILPITGITNAHSVKEKCLLINGLQTT